jgi:hypothetical protein
MSEWLGKNRILREDIEGVLPSFVRHFPMLTKYYVDSQKLRIVLPLDYDEGDRFKKAVIDTFGSFNATNVRRAASDAISAWIEAHPGRGDT